MISPEDSSRIDEILRWCDEHDPDGERFRVQPFRDMLERDHPLSEKQRTWTKAIYEQIFDVPEYQNLVSSGQVPRGREVATPAVLQNLPKKPPVRRRVEDD
jgi:hypothetical protein